MSREHACLYYFVMYLLHVSYLITMNDLTEFSTLYNKMYVHINDNIWFYVYDHN